MYKNHIGLILFYFLNDFLNTHVSPIDDIKIEVTVVF